MLRSKNKNNFLIKYKHHHLPFVQIYFWLCANAGSNAHIICCFPNFQVYNLPGSQDVHSELKLTSERYFASLLSTCFASLAIHSYCRRAYAGHSCVPRSSNASACCVSHKCAAFSVGKVLGPVRRSDSCCMIERGSIRAVIAECRLIQRCAP